MSVWKLRIIDVLRWLVEFYDRHTKSLEERCETYVEPVENNLVQRRQ